MQLLQEEFLRKVKERMDRLVFQQIPTQLHRRVLTVVWNSIICCCRPRFGVLLDVELFHATLQECQLISAHGAAHRQLLQMLLLSSQGRLHVVASSIS